MGELKKKYSTQLATVKELFPDWTNEDVVYALQENNGDLEGTIEKITEGASTSFIYSITDEARAATMPDGHCSDCLSDLSRY